MRRYRKVGGRSRSFVYMLSQLVDLYENVQALFSINMVFTASIDETPEFATEHATIPRHQQHHRTRKHLKLVRNVV
jgi:hypothetical protein